MSYDYAIIRPREGVTSIEEVDCEDKLLPIGKVEDIKRTISSLHPAMKWEYVEGGLRRSLLGTLMSGDVRLEVGLPFEEQYIGRTEETNWINITTSVHEDSGTYVKRIADAIDAEAWNMQRMQRL